MKRTLKTMAALAALVWLLPPTSTASAQDPAVTAAIEELERMVEGSYWLGDSTVAILRQAFGPRTLAELDWLADRLAAMVADTTVSDPVRRHAMLALAGAASLDRGRRGRPPRLRPAGGGSRTFHRTTWCEAGYILCKDVVYKAKRRTWPGGGIPTNDHEPTPIPDGLPEHVEDWYRRCQ